MLREVIVKIGLKRIDMQEKVMVEALLDSEAMRLVISSEFVNLYQGKGRCIHC